MFVGITNHTKTLFLQRNVKIFPVRYSVDSFEQDVKNVGSFAEPVVKSIKRFDSFRIFRFDSGILDFVYLVDEK